MKQPNMHTPRMSVDELNIITGLMHVLRDLDLLYDVDYATLRSNLIDRVVLGMR